MAQQPLNIGTGVESGDGDPLRVIFAKIANNLSDLDGRLISNTALIGTLGGAAFLNVGTTTGTVADGGLVTANTAAIAAETSRAQSVELLKAPIASPAFTGIPTAPTAAAGTGTTQIATTAFVATAVAAGGGGGGTGGVPTSRQILTAGAATGGGDLTADRTVNVPIAAPSDVATGTDNAKVLTSLSIAAALGAKAPLASPALVGTPTVPTAAAGTSTTQAASTAFVATSYAPLASPALTGNPTAPTQASADSSTKLATTAYADRSATNAITPAPSAPSTNTTLTTADADRPLFPAGSPTITAANGGAGWRTGSIFNANTLTGLVTLAVPSGATLDGATNGTTVLRPYQKARIVQTGAATYITDWIDRTPIVGAASITSSVSSVALILPAGYSTFEFSHANVYISNTATFAARFSTDGGTTFPTSGYYYNFLLGQGTSASYAENTSAAYIELAPNVASNTVGLSGSGAISSGGGITRPWLRHTVPFSQPANGSRMNAGRYETVSTVNAVQFLVTAGAMTSGSFTIRGVP